MIESLTMQQYKAECYPPLLKWSGERVNSKGPLMSLIYRSRAAQIIEKWWIRVRNRKVFEVLKRAVCTAVRNTVNEARDVT